MNIISSCCSAPMKKGNICRGCGAPCAIEYVFDPKEAVVSYQPSETRFEFIYKVVMEDAEKYVTSEVFRNTVREYAKMEKLKYHKAYPYNVLVVICNKTKKIMEFYA